MHGAEVAEDDAENTSDDELPASWVQFVSRSIPIVTQFLKKPRIEDSLGSQKGRKWRLAGHVAK
jgi:hypothetical protein